MILITGSGGLLGSAVYRRFSARAETVGMGLHDVGQERFLHCDLTDHPRTAELFRRAGPAVVIHAAARKDVAGCERDPEGCRAINAEATRHLAGLAAEAGAFLVYISTDHVFGGERGGYRETDAPDHRTRYGSTKAEGETAVAGVGGAICRTSGVYAWNGPSPTFLDFVVGALRAGRSLDLYVDVHNSPTYLGNLCEMIERVVELRRPGIYHTAGPDRMSRYGFGLRVAESLGFDASLLRPVDAPSEEAWRPRDVSLDVERTRRVLGVPFLGVAEGLERLKAEGDVPTEC